MKNNLFNIEAEQIVLGAIIIDNRYLNKASDYLKKEYFYEPAHQIIFDHIIHTTQKANLVADSITLKTFFDNDELLKTIGGSKYLSILLSIGAGIVDIVDYAKIIQDLALKRNLVLIGEDIIKNARENSNKIVANKQIEVAIDKIFKLQYHYESNLQNIFLTNEYAKEIHEQNLCLEDRNYKYSDVILTGFRNFDNNYNGIGGLKKKEFTILAGRPSMGKSTLAIAIIKNLIFDNKKVLFFSLEMNKKSIIQKLLANMGKINSYNIRNRSLSKEEFNINTKNIKALSQTKLFINNKNGINSNYIRNYMKRIISIDNKPIDLIVIDHIQKMKSCEKIQQRHLELKSITNDLTNIAKEFNCGLLALCQLSRGISNRDNKIPNLEDLRESGSIEEDADVVIFIYREVYYLRWTLNNLDSKRIDYQARKSFLQGEIKKRENWCDLFIKKNRNGPVGKVELDFEPKYSFFKDRTEKIKTWRKSNED